MQVVGNPQEIKAATMRRLAGFRFPSDRPWSITADDRDADSFPL
jgi:hypothetical protein